MRKKIKAQHRNHLVDLIMSEMIRKGNNCDLNHIDISDVKNLSAVFSNSEFNGNISEWDTSQVFSMENMFHSSKFNGDISNWDVRNVIYMNYMFTYSEFVQDLSIWKPYKAERPSDTFTSARCPKPYWTEYEEKDERAIAINAYHLKKGIMKELTDELMPNLDNKKKKLKV
jgi:surface protein